MLGSASLWSVGLKPPSVPDLNVWAGFLMKFSPKLGLYPDGY